MNFDLDFWQGLPQTWRLLKNRYLFSERNERGFDDLPLVAVSQKYGVLPKRDLEAMEQRKLSTEDDDLGNYKRVAPGDIVYNKMRMWQGAVGVASVEGIVSPAYVVARPRETVNSRFFAYLLKSTTYVTQSGLASYGICDDQNSLRWDDFAALPSPVPPPDVQERVANFLDAQTARIDALIAEKERLIELLAEQRLSVAERVLAGAPSGEEVKLGFLVDLLPGYAFPSDDFSRDPSDIPLLRGINVVPGSLRWDDVVYWTKAYESSLERFRLRLGDVVFGMDRPWVSDGARVAVIDEASVGTFLLQRVCRLRGRGKLYQRFLYYGLASDKFRQSVEVDLTGVSVPHISPDQILRFKVPDLSPAEQKARVDAADSEVLRIEQLESHTAQMLDHLREYRSSLISAAVTGQVDMSSYKLEAA